MHQNAPNRVLKFVIFRD